MKVKMNQNASGDPNILLDKDFSVPADEPIALYATKLLAGGVSDLKSYSTSEAIPTTPMS